MDKKQIKEYNIEINKYLKTSIITHKLAKFFVWLMFEKCDPAYAQDCEYYSQILNQYITQCEFPDAVEVIDVFTKLGIGD